MSTWIADCGHEFIIKRALVREAAEYLSGLTGERWDADDFEEVEDLGAVAAFRIRCEEGPLWGPVSAGSRLEEKLEKFADRYLLEGSYLKLYHDEDHLLTMHKVGPKGIATSFSRLEDLFDSLEAELDEFFERDAPHTEAEKIVPSDTRSPVAALLSSRSEATVVWNNLLLSAVPYEQDGSDAYSVTVFDYSGAVPTYICEPVYTQTPTLGAALEKATLGILGLWKEADFRNIAVVCERGGRGYDLAALAHDLEMTERSLARDVEVARDLSHEPFIDEWTAQMNGDGVEAWTKSWDGTYSIWCCVARGDDYDDKDIPYAYLVNDVNGCPGPFVYASEPIAEGVTPDFAWAEEEISMAVAQGKSPRSPEETQR